MKRKLLRTERRINVYKKTRSKFLQDPVREINVDGIPLNVLQELVIANTNDPLLYSAYRLNKKQLDKLSVLLEKPVASDFKTFEYYLECYGMYDSGAK